MRGNTVNLLLPNSVYGHMALRSASTRPVGIAASYYGPRLSRFLAETVSYVFLLRKAIPAAFRAHVILSHHHPSRLAVFCAAVTSVVSHRPMVARADDIVAGKPRGARENIAGFVLRVCIKWSLKKAQLVLVNGDELVEVIQRMYRLSKDVVGVSRNGVDTERFSPKRRSEDLRAGIGSRHILVFSGALYANRGVDVLLNAVPLLRERVADLKVLILGDGPELTRLLHLARNLHIADTANFLGTVNPDLVPDYLASSDVGIGPLRASSVTVGTYPLKVLEYMASGCVVVSVKDALSRRLIVHSQTGLVTESSDPRELAETIQAALSDKETSRRVSDNARALVERSYSWDAVVTKLETILRSAVENSSG